MINIQEKEDIKSASPCSQENKLHLKNFIFFQGKELVHGAGSVENPEKVTEEDRHVLIYIQSNFSIKPTCFKSIVKYVYFLRIIVSEV